jgi:hypothetical protein
MSRFDPRDLKAFLRMYVEVGTCIWGLQHFMGRLWIVPALLSAYFLGHLLQGAVRLAVSKIATAAVLVLALVALTVAMALPSAGLVAGSLFLIGFTFGPGLVPVPLSKRSRVVKIGSKLFGMVAAAVVIVSALPFGAAAVGVALAYFFLANSPAVQVQDSDTPSWNPVSCINIFHQASYFAFVFVFWALWRQSISWAPAAFFVLGWIGYWAMELKLAAPGAPYRPRLLAMGHLAVAIVLSAMAAFSSPLLLMLGWFLTGVGGGTCYTMERAPQGKPNRTSDDVGALLGAASGTGALLLFHTPEAPLLAGAAYALVASALALITASTSSSRSAATCVSSK